MAHSLSEQLRATLSGTYTLERELGGGGMSRVFLATETALGREVVIKIIAPELAQGVSAERFTREVKLAARLQQANIVPLLNAGEAAGVPYYTMPYVDGASLRTRLDTGGRVPRGEAVHILRDVAKALAYAHARGVVHRDIKPENVLLSGGTAMVIDFGIAKALTESRTHGGDERATSAASLTSTGTSLGTPAYMAPEQAVGGAVDHRADLYAWGVMAYELLAGAHPFANKTTAAEMAAAHIVEMPTPISDREPSIPAPIADIVMSCLAKDPAQRPDSAGALLAALDGAASAVTTQPTGPRVPPSRASAGAIRRTAVIAAGVLLVAAGGAWLAKRGRGVASPAEMTLAVLPIENLGGDSSTEYLADGMTSELANALKKVAGLQVTGDLSTSRFKGAHTAPAEIAKQLGVAMLLNGKLQPGRGRVRLQMQLSRPDGKLLWSNTYDRADKDNFAMQDEITSAIASELRVVLTPRTVAVTRAGRTTNPQAHDLYLRGVFEKNKLTPEGLNKALAYFEEALKLDSNYAQAHAGVAFAYDLLADVYMPSHEYHMLALAAAERAVQCDSLLAEGRALHGYEIAATTWDLAGGEAEMDRALAMDPNSPDALFMYGVLSYLSGDIDRAIGFADRLLKIEPLSALAARTRAEALVWGGRYQEALTADSLATALDSNVLIWEPTRGLALLELGRPDEAAAIFQAFEKTSGNPSVGLAMTYGRMGKRTEALEVIHQFEARERRQWVEPTFIAFAYAGIGDADNTMKWLETGYAKRSFSLRLFMNWDVPWLKVVWRDPRYLELKRKIVATTAK
jgi:TolB-like protein/tRNA A-37 threonylcarbamoyl transferase component Bud32